MSSDVKEIVQDKYGEAAKRVRTGEGLPRIAAPKRVAAKALLLRHVTPSPRIFTMKRRKAACRKRPFSRRSAAAIRPRWLN